MTRTIQELTDAFDFSALRVRADEIFGQREVVDWDMRGTPLTRSRVLLTGAYGPAARRTIALAAERYAGVTRKLSREQLLALAAEAFPAAEDKDYAGNIITDYSLVLEQSYGYGPTLLKLARLAIAEREVFARAPA